MERESMTFHQLVLRERDSSAADHTEGDNEADDGVIPAAPHVQPSLSCRRCDVVFDSVEAFRLHVRTHVAHRSSGDRAVAAGSSGLDAQGSSDSNSSGSDDDDPPEGAGGDDDDEQSSATGPLVPVTVRPTGQKGFVFRVLLTTSGVADMVEAASDRAHTARLTIGREVLFHPAERWAVFMLQSGYFAAAAWEMAPPVSPGPGSAAGAGTPFAEPPFLPRCILHKRYARYTTRKKQGGSQSAHDASRGSTAKSVGANLRRAGELHLQQDITGLLKDPEWAATVGSCRRIFIAVPRAITSQLYDGSTLVRGDPRIARVPFMTGRPSLLETQRIVEMLGRLYAAAAPSSRPQPAAPVSSKARSKRPEEAAQAATADASSAQDGAGSTMSSRRADSNSHGLPAAEPPAVGPAPRRLGTGGGESAQALGSLFSRRRSAADSEDSVSSSSDEEENGVGPRDASSATNELKTTAFPHFPRGVIATGGGAGAVGSGAATQSRGPPMPSKKGKGRPSALQARAGAGAFPTPVAAVPADDSQLLASAIAAAEAEATQAAAERQSWNDAVSSRWACLAAADSLAHRLRVPAPILQRFLVLDRPPTNRTTESLRQLRDTVASATERMGTMRLLLEEGGASPAQVLGAMGWDSLAAAALVAGSGMYVDWSQLLQQDESARHGGAVDEVGAEEELGVVAVPSAGGSRKGRKKGKRGKTAAAAARVELDVPPSPHSPAAAAPAPAAPPVSEAERRRALMRQAAERRAAELSAAAAPPAAAATPAQSILRAAATVAGAWVPGLRPGGQ